MPTENLAPQGVDYLGAAVVFSCPHFPFQAGDPYFLSITAPPASEAPNGLHEVGTAIPLGSAYPTYYGDIAAGQTVEIFGTCAADGGQVALAIGVLPPGGPFPVNTLGYHLTQYGPAPPPAPAPVLGLPNLIAAVEASWQSHIAVADWRTDGATVMYQSAPPYLPAPIVATIPFMYCLSDAKAAAIAGLLGGAVEKLPPTGYYSDLYAVGGIPGVNWIFATINGAPMKALGMALVQAFDNTADVLLARVTAAFQSA